MPDDETADGRRRREKRDTKKYRESSLYVRDSTFENDDWMMGIEKIDLVEFRAR